MPSSSTLRLLAGVARSFGSASSSCARALSPALDLLGGQVSSQPSASLLARHFGTSRLAANSLAQVLREEISYEKQQYQKPEQLAAGPPAPFKLTDSPGDTLLSLTRSYNNESISIDLHVNNQPSAPFDNGDEDADESLNFVAFNVSVSKGDTSLVFECESDGTCVNINHISCEPKDGIEQESVYTGPVFAELDENLQKQFQAYLEERGITPEFGEYLRFLIYDKEQREYTAWLQKVQDFVSKN